MEPTLPAPHGSPEMGPSPMNPELPVQQGGEVHPALERHEAHEQKAGGADPGPAPVIQPTAQPAPVIVPNPMAQPSAVSIGDTPATAADEDVIEKEWVEKAKKVIAETKHDPYLQEQAVSRLQADYLQKRYGKTVKLPDEA